MPAPDHPAPGPANTTLGIVAGGLATRLGGIDKAWLERDGVPQVLRCASAFRDVTCATLVSANRDPARYLPHSLEVVADRASGGGPVAGLAALADACRSAWLLTMPVDLVEFRAAVALRLFDAAGADGAVASDDDGVQPLVALWRVAALRTAVHALPRTDVAVRALQARMAMGGVCLHGRRFGNLNTAADLRVAGIGLPGEQRNEP